jgi:hypothetical protein
MKKGDFVTAASQLCLEFANRKLFEWDTAAAVLCRLHYLVDKNIDITQTKTESLVARKKTGPEVHVD